MGVPNSPASQPETWAKIVGYIFFIAIGFFSKLWNQIHNSQIGQCRCLFCPSAHARRSRCFAVARGSKIDGLVFLFPNREALHTNRPFRFKGHGGFLDKIDAFFIHHDCVTRCKVHKPIVNPEEQSMDAKIFTACHFGERGNITVASYDFKIISIRDLNAIPRNPSLVWDTCGQLDMWKKMVPSRDSHLSKSS